MWNRLWQWCVLAVAMLAVVLDPRIPWNNDKKTRDRSDDMKTRDRSDGRRAE